MISTHSLLVFLPNRVSVRAFWHQTFATKRKIRRSMAAASTTAITKSIKCPKLLGPIKMFLKGSGRLVETKTKWRISRVCFNNLMLRILQNTHWEMEIGISLKTTITQTLPSYSYAIKVQSISMGA